MSVRGTVVDSVVTISIDREDLDSDPTPVCIIPIENQKFPPYERAMVTVCHRCPPL